MAIQTHVVVSGDTLWALAERFYGDGSLYPVLVIANQLPDPDSIAVGQQLAIPDVTYRHKVVAGDTKRALAIRYYGREEMLGVYEIANHAAQRDIRVGEWLLIPDLANPGHHTVVAGETLPDLAARWYGETNLWPIIAIANELGDSSPTPGQVLIQPGLNRRRKVVSGDTLWQMTKDNYGDHDVATRVSLVAAANHIADADQISVGQVIFFPGLTS